MKIGELIIKNICDVDPNSDEFKKDKSKNQKVKLFKQLARTIEKKGEEGEGLPQKTWLYNSVRLVHDKKELSDCTEYASLSISHKITILPIPNKEAKVEVIKQIVAGKLSVRKTREIVYSKLDQGEKNLLFYINNPNEIESLDDVFSVNVDIKSKTVLIKTGHQKIEKIEQKIASEKEDLEKLKALVKRLERQTLMRSKRDKNAKY